MTRLSSDLLEHRLRQCESANIYQARGNLRLSSSQETKTREQIHEGGTFGEHVQYLDGISNDTHGSPFIINLQLAARKYLHCCHNFGFIHL